VAFFPYCHFNKIPEGRGGNFLCSVYCLKQELQNTYEGLKASYILEDFSSKIIIKPALGLKGIHSWLSGKCGFQE